MRRDLLARVVAWQGCAARDVRAGQREVWRSRCSRRPGRSSACRIPACGARSKAGVRPKRLSAAASSNCRRPHRRRGVEIAQPLGMGQQHDADMERAEPDSSGARQARARTDSRWRRPNWAERSRRSPAAGRRRDETRLLSGSGQPRLNHLPVRLLKNAPSGDASSRPSTFRSASVGATASISGCEVSSARRDSRRSATVRSAAPRSVVPQDPHLLGDRPRPGVSR